MGKSVIPPSEALYPVPVVLVTCMDRPAGRSNIITIAWCGVIASNPPTVSISIRPSRHSHKLISCEREFAVNIPSTDILKQADICGIVSGKGADKFKLSGLTPVKASKLSCAIIDECPVNIECSLKDVYRYGTHDVFIGEVIAVNASKEALKPDGRIDHERTKPFVYSNGEYWDLGKKVGFYGFSSKK